MKAIELLRRYAAAVWLATAVLVAFGLGAAWSMPSGIYPEVEFPRIVVVARVGDALPDVYLTTITRPLEQALTTVLGVERIRSQTIRGATDISLQFAPGTDMWRALQGVEASVAEVRSDLPPGIEIAVEKITTGSFPVITFNLSGPVDPRELREFGEFVARPALAGVAGVGRVEVLGGDEREVEVVLDPEATSALHLTPGLVAERLRSAMGLDARHARADSGAGCAGAPGASFGALRGFGRGSSIISVDTSKTCVLNPANVPICVSAQIHDAGELRIGVLSRSTEPVLSCAGA